MARKTDNPGNLWHELKRYEVVHGIIVFAAVAFCILQITVIENLQRQLPEWVEAMIIVLLSIGFVIPILHSSIYNISPSVFKKTKVVSTWERKYHYRIRSSPGWKEESLGQNIEQLQVN